MKLMWAEKHGNHTYIYWRGQPIYKRWDNDPNHPSIIFDKFFNYWIANHEEKQTNPQESTKAK